MDYWIARNNEKIGPMSLEQLRDMDIEPETLVWHDGMPTWCKAYSLPELADIFEARSAKAPTMPPPEPAAANPRAEATIAPPPMPPTYLGWSVAAILLCCLIPAIVALVYSFKVSSRYYAGDFAGAQKASDRAELWLIISIVAGLVSMPFYIVFNLF